jgi:hypothetical protein
MGADRTLMQVKVRCGLGRVGVLGRLYGNSRGTSAPGSNSEVGARNRHVRFPPDSYQTADIAGGPVRANGRRRSLAADAFDGSVLAQDRHVGRFGGFQSLTRVGGQGDGYQKLIAVIVAVCGHRL